MALSSEARLAARSTAVKHAGYRQGPRTAV